MNFAFCTFSLLMFFFHFFFLYFSFFLFNLDYYFDLTLFFFGFFKLSLIFVFDFYSMFFGSIVSLITSVVLVYSYYYMSSYFSLNSYFFLLLLFVLSMLILIYSCSFFILMFGWDGLGLVSFCLIIYYGGFSSLRSGLVTIFLNRLGDIGLLVSMFFFLVFFDFSFVSCWMTNSVLFFFIFVISSMTKSAQVPFSSWLPAAMSAPTPISSLVHSSTLVTAGVYLLFRFYFFISFFIPMFVLYFLSIFTMFVAGLVAMVEQDMKKVIAMSTLSQLGMMMFMLSLGEKFYCFFHMMTHALFKSLLFMSCGGFISMSGGEQDIRSSGSFVLISPGFSLFFGVSSLSLMGFPFLSGFFSKDFCLDSMFELSFSFLSLFIFLLNCVFTACYSFRLYFFGMVFFSNMPYMVYNFNYYSWFMMFFLFFSSITVGFLFCVFFFCDLLLSFFLFKIVGLFIVLVGYFLLYFKFFNHDYFSSVLFMDFFFGFYISSMVYKFDLFSYVDLLWLEKFGPLFFFNSILFVGDYFNYEFFKDYYFIKFYFFMCFYLFFLFFFLLI